MNAQETRKRRARRFQCEMLENRNLLSAVVPASVPAEVHALKTTVVTHVITGTISGRFSVGLGLHVTANGAGNLTVMGATTETGGYNLTINSKTHKVTATGGRQTYSSALGSITVSFAGSGKVTNGVITYTVSGSIVGGTGEFAAASGTFSATGTSPDALAGAYSMKVSITAKTKT